jgi:hypothetical protein
MRIYKFQNKLGQALKVYLEPWGDEFIVPPMADFIIDILQTRQASWKHTLRKVHSLSGFGAAVALRYISTAKSKPGHGSLFQCQASPKHNLSTDFTDYTD